jgi:hypothetical protein
MKDQMTGRRYPLLLYRRTMDRICKSALTLGMVLLVAWAFSLLRDTFFIGISSDAVIFVAGIVALTEGIIAFVARNLAYVQAHKNYLSIVTPFLRLKVAYRRLRSIHPVLMQQLFLVREGRWSQRKYLEPFYGKTALVVDLYGYPLNPALLRLFFPAQMFSPRSTGFVLLVPDWMEFSTELDTFHASWLHSQQKKVSLPGKTRGSQIYSR